MITCATASLARRMVSRDIRAEWTKLRSVPGATWRVVAVVAVTLGAPAFVAAVGA